MDAKTSDRNDRNRPEACASAWEFQRLMVQAGQKASNSAHQPPSHDIIAPKVQSLPMVFSSPHSGDDYPAEFLATSRLSALELRRSEDSFVDELFAAAPEEGAPLLRALFPRAYVDPNREPFELDQTMFSERLPDYANTRSPRVVAGLGTIAKVVANGAEIYQDKLTFEEVSDRISRHYWPYHAALRQLVEQTRKRFGFCVLIDCHSMPSQVAYRSDEITANLNGDAPRPQPVAGKANWQQPANNRCSQANSAGAECDMILGDSHGQACADSLTDSAEASLRAMGYRVGRNDPYSGGFVTRHYGRPKEKVHALQIEISRGLYMDEARIQRHPDLSPLQADLRRLIRDLGAAVSRDLAP